MNYSDGDVLLLSTEDGGDINMTDGIIEMTGGFETAAYLSLFGGNDDDDGTTAKERFQFWGNLTEVDDINKKMTSRTGGILTGYPATPANLNLVKNAIRLDLAWMIDESIVDSFDIALSITAKNRISITIDGIKNRAKLFNTKYERNWNYQGAE